MFVKELGTNLARDLGGYVATIPLVGQASKLFKLAGTLAQNAKVIKQGVDLTKKVSKSKSLAEAGKHADKLKNNSIVKGFLTSPFVKKLAKESVHGIGTGLGLASARGLEYTEADAVTDIAFGAVGTAVGGAIGKTKIAQKASEKAGKFAETDESKQIKSTDDIQAQYEKDFPKEHEELTNLKNIKNLMKQKKLELKN